MFNVKEFNDSRLIELCNDIYDWDTGNGDIPENSKLKSLISAHFSGYPNAYYIRDLIISEAYERFNKVAKLLVRDKTWFIK